MQNNPFYNWEIDHGDPADPESNIIVSISPHSGLISKWRIMIPANYEGIIEWGIYSKESKELVIPRGSVETDKITMQDGLEVKLKGGVESITKNKPAQIICKNPPPHFIAFGYSEDEISPPQNLEGIAFEDHPH